MSDEHEPPWTGGGIQCKANSKQSGKRCRRAASPGHLVCTMHGSRSPQAKARAARDQVDTEITRTVAALGGTPVDNPLLALQEVAGEILAWKDAVKGHVKELEKWRYSGDVGTEQIRGEIILWERALDRAANVLGMIAKLNIDDRLAKIEEAKVSRVVEALGTVLGGLDLTVAQQLKAKSELARLLRKAG